MKPNNETIAHELAIEYLRISAAKNGAGSIDGFARSCKIYCVNSQSMVQ